MAHHGQAAGHGPGHRRPQVSGRTRALNRAEGSRVILDAEWDATLVTTCVRASLTVAPPLVRVVSRVDAELRLQA